MSRPSIPAKRPLAAPAEAQEAAWVADEDRFVLRQAKKKAVLRVKGGRAQPIDWLAVTLVVIDPEHNHLDDEVDDEDLDVLEPESVFEHLDDAQLAELENGIDTYATLEHSRSNRDYWNVCWHFLESYGSCALLIMLLANSFLDDEDYLPLPETAVENTQPSARGVDSVASDLDKLLGPKTLEELEMLEKQIRRKLASDEPLDRDYWEHLLGSLLTYKARARLREVSQSILQSRLAGLRKQQVFDASMVKMRLSSQSMVPTEGPSGQDTSQITDGSRHALDPELLLRLRPEDKLLEAFDKVEFAEKLRDERQKVVKQGYIPGPKRSSDLVANGRESAAKRQRTGRDETNLSMTSAFDREVARGLSENEEVFTTEEEVETRSTAQWSGKHRPRKPKHFNRVHTGYEWNKYNQTHYDHDNPPPKVVQGYKFNIFYPDLIDKNQGANV